MAVSRIVCVIQMLNAEKCAFILDLNSGCKMFPEKGVSCHQLMTYETDPAFAGDGDTHV